MPLHQPPAPPGIVQYDVFMNTGQRISAYLDEIAEHWLGYALPPVERAVGGWLPDAAGEYCTRCGDSVGPGEANETGCGSCRETHVGVDRFVRLGSYSGAMRDWVLLIKYKHRWVEMAQYLGKRLGQRVRSSGVLDGEAIVVPMPMPWQRRLYRGIDHARVIAEGVGRELGLDVASVLSKRNGPTQVSLASSMRLREGARGLRVRRAWWGLAGDAAKAISGGDVVLVDDVRTTGASIRAACRLLRGLGARRVVAAVVSISDDHARRDRSEQRRVEG